MDQIPHETQEDRQFSAILFPHRSLGPKGFLILMSLIGGISFAAGLFFYIIGAWPIFGFFGLDFALIYIAFRLNYRSGRLYETVVLTHDTLTVTRTHPSGKQESWRFNPYWARLSLSEAPGQITELRLASHGQELVFGRFLPDDEKRDFAAALARALHECRGGTRV